MNKGDNSGYSARWIRFVRVPVHAEAYRAAYLDQSASSSHELERLRREFITKPSDHDCSCRCPSEARGYPPCAECLKLRRNKVNQDIALEMGRSSVPDSVVPMVLMLDLERAMQVLGEQNSATRLARYLNGGTEAA